MEKEFPRLISASSRELFSTCPQKFYLSVITGFTPKDVSPHLTFGGAYAAALEAFRSEYFKNPAQLPPDLLYDAAVARGLHALILHFGPEDPPPEQKKNFARCVGAFVEYLFRYPPASEHAPPSYNVLGPRVEFSFTFEVPECFHPVTGDPILYHGRFDQLVDFNGGLFVMDDKTTSSMGALWKHQWALRSQFTGYVAGARSHDLQIVGAIVRGMAILTNEFKTEEAITYRPQWLVDRWTIRLTHDVKRMLQCWKDDYWPHQGEESHACYNYGICAYHVLCTSQNPSHYAPVYFDEGRWDPVTRQIIRPAVEATPETVAVTP